jgi:hypothetical protein
MLGNDGAFLILMPASMFCEAAKKYFPRVVSAVREHADDTPWQRARCLTNGDKRNRRSGELLFKTMTMPTDTVPYRPRRAT